MSGKSLAKTVEVEILPSCRDHLLAGVSPAVGEMEVNHHAHTKAICPRSFFDHIRNGIPLPFGIHPHTQTYSIDAAIVAQQLHTLFLNAPGAAGVELTSLRLHLRYPAHICTAGETYILCRRFSFSGKPHQENSGNKKILCFHDI